MKGHTMRVPLINMQGQVTEILDSRQLTDAEWKLVKKNRSGALSLRELPGNKRDDA
jgi:hypothetical protein